MIEWPAFHSHSLDERYFIGESELGWDADTFAEDGTVINLGTYPTLDAAKLACLLHDQTSPNA